MPKVLLINPYQPKSDHIQPPLGLGYLATALRKNNYSANILDANRQGIKIEKLSNFIEKENPEVVGFQLYSMNIDYVKKALSLVKKINPNIITLVGGPHSSALPSEIFKTMGRSLDFGFCGEAEAGLPKLLNSLLGYSDDPDFSSIPGLIYQKRMKTFINPPYFHKNLDDFGFPAWDLLKPQEYPEAQHGAFFQNFPIAPIITTRGCPFSCSFCAARLNNGNILRKRSIKNILREISLLYNDYRVREFHIVDDNFTLDHKFAKEVLQSIIKLNLNLSFAVPNGVRLDTLDEELLKLMKKAGFYLISVGIESGSDRVLKMMNKKLMSAQIREKIKLIRNAGLEVAGFFILGYPGETENEIKKTIDFSLNLPLLRANYFLFLPLPGTTIFQKLQKAERSLLKKIDFTKFSFTEPNISFGINRKKLKKLQRQAFFKFFLWRPQILLKNLFSIKRPKQFFFLARRAINWLA